MKQILNISVCQTDVLWENPDGNRKRLEGLILEHIDSVKPGLRPDLLVLPEFFTTGFTSNVKYAEPESGGDG